MKFAGLLLFACCLLSWNTYSNAAIAAISRADSDNPAGIMDIQNKLLQIQAEVPSIHTAINTGGNLVNVPNHIDSLVEQSQRLKQDLDNLSRATSDSMRNIGLTLLNTHHKAVDAQLESLKLALKEKTQSLSQTLPTEIIAAIKEHRFKFANKKFINMSYNEISKIIQAVYANSSDNFGIIIDLTNSLTYVNPSFLVLKALYGEMENNGHRDPYKMMILGETLEVEVVNQKSVIPDSKASAENIIREIVESIKVKALDTFKAAVDKGQFERGGQVDLLANAILAFRPQLSDEIIQHIVNDTYGVVPAKKILDYISSYEAIESVVTGMHILFQNIKDAGNLNTDMTMHFAAQLRRLELNQNYTSSSQEKQGMVDKLIENLPVCARSLYFKPSICFWNRAKEEFVYAGNSTNNYDEERRSIFSGEEVVPEAHWQAEQIGNNFYFKNRRYTNEYLYAAAIDFNKDLRYVLNWIPGNNMDEQSAWRVELNGDYCYLRSVYYNEYLFASNLMKPNGTDLRYVFTWKPGTAVRSTEFQWQIKHCD